MRLWAQPLPPMDDVLVALEHAFMHHTEPHARRGGVALKLADLDVSVRPLSGDIDDFAVELSKRLAEVACYGFATALTDPSPAGTRKRMELITTLARIEASQGMRKERPTDASGETLLTTAEAAAQLGMSRPHVSMLCDQGKLGVVTRSEGGHRRIRQAAVDAYRNTHAAAGTAA
jgi:excisionase family DNA binding protein